MTIVAGVDFGTLSVRVTLVDSEEGPLEPPRPHIRFTAGAKTQTMPRNRTPTR